MSTKLSRTPNLTPAAAGELVGCNERTIRRAIAAGELRAYRLGKRRSIRISEYDLHRWLKPVTPLAEVVAAGE